MYRTLFNRYSSISVLITFALLAVVACAASQDTRPSPAADPNPPRASPQAGATSQSVQTIPAVVSSTPSARPAASSTRKSAGNDSTAKDPPITVPSVKGRTKKDSLALVKAVRVGAENPNWPVKTATQLPGAILPGHRIVAFYGNPLSKRMGILGELPPEQMLARFDKEIAAWTRADPSTPVQPALHLIAVVTTGSTSTEVGRGAVR